MPITLTPENQNEYINDNHHKNIIIDFGASWCNPCNEFKPIFTATEKDFSDVLFLTADVNTMDELASDYDIKSLPTIVFIKEGNEVGRFSGKKTAPEFKKFVSVLLDQ
jgi:thiol-disulfide isomerase/thioredoxin